MRKKGNIIILTGFVLLAAALALFLYNEYESYKAGKAADEVLTELKEEIADNAAANTDEENSLTDLFPDREMPTVTIDGNVYVGRICVPSVGIDLPVMDSWSYAQLDISPCRYTGSIYQKNMVIAGHSYRTHFAPLYRVKIGDEVDFYDAEGQEYRYVVSNLETLDPDQNEYLTEDNDDWDLTLFTCTIGGRTRHTVRCILIED